KLYELDTSIRNIPYGRDFFYGVNKDSKQSLYVDLFAPFMKGFCDTNGEAIREGEKVLVFPVGRSLLGKITREGSFEYVILEGFVREEVDNHSDPRAYGMGVEGQYTESLRECDDLVEASVLDGNVTRAHVVDVDVSCRVVRSIELSCSDQLGHDWETCPDN
ncbi:hypothetical protein FOZ63_004323, partial [Perkinsus olseni]